MEGHYDITHSLFLSDRAEIPKYLHRSMEEFWAAAPSLKSQTIRAFATTGAKVIVAERAPTDAATAAGWQRIGKTDYYAYLLTR
jgi:hypothetical protein